MLRIIAAIVLFSFAVVAQAADEEEKTWEGTWNNRAAGSSGRMKCVAKPEKDGDWKATFSGTFQGRQFSYDVTFKSKPGKGQETLTGNATVNGYKYKWTGTIKGETLTGRYQANNGYNGDFVLKAPKKK